MSQQWYSMFERWTSGYKKVNKVKNVILQFTGRGKTHDVPIIMSQLPRDSMTSLYKLNNSENLQNSLNISKTSTEISNETRSTISEDKSVCNTQVTIDLDSISNSCVNTIEIDGFKFKILKYVENEDGEYSETVRVKIILPKNTSYSFNNENNDEEVQNHHEAEAFKPEDFSALNERFVAFANSLIDVGSLDFIPVDLACSSPLPEVEEDSDLDEVKGSFLNPIPELEKRNVDDTKNKALNNSLDLSNDKDMKLVEFIDNISIETLELSLNETNCSNPIEKNNSIVAGKVQNLKDNSPKRRIAYYDGLKKQNFHNRNITNPESHADSRNNLNNATNHSIDSCDCKYVKPFQFDARNSTSELTQKENYSEVPIMGQNALLTKLRIAKQQKDESHKKTDPEIIEEIVKDRFRNFLTEHRKRGMKRKPRTQISLSFEGENEDGHCDAALNCDKHQAIGEIVFENGDKATVVENGNPQHHLFPEIYVTNWNESSNEELDQEKRAVYRRTTSVSDGGFVSGGSSSKMNKPPDTQIHSLISSATSLASRDFGEFIESGLFDSEYNFVGGVEYDPQKFLNTALGDDADLSTTFYEEPFDEPCKVYAAHYERAFSMDHSIGTSEMSALISGQSMGTLSEMRAKNLAKAMEVTIDEEIDPKSLTYDNNAKTTEQQLLDLTRESAIQFQIIQQTLKALDLCKSVKEFVSSPEQIEAEKILLTATCQREAIVQEIRRLQMRENREQPDHPGFVQLSNFRFPSKSIGCHTSDSAKKNKDYTQWFLCIINCGTKVFATDAGIADFEGSVCFNTQVSFGNLKPDFEITVTIYAMKVKNNLRTYSHESKYHLNEHSKATCPSPNKFLGFRRRSTTRLPEPSLKPSSFTLWGTGSIKIDDLGKRTSFQMQNVPKCSTLCDQFFVAIESSVDIKEHFSDFLHVGTQNNSNFVSWNRRWCTLNDTELRLWNDPTGCGNPVDVIDLKSCINYWISTVERSICARPKTLLLETRNSSRQLIRYLLNADTTEDMKKWMSVLNSVLSSLRSWHCMKYSSSELDETSL